MLWYCRSNIDKETYMQTCLDCVRKHLAAAKEFFGEAVDGYPLHGADGIGHLWHAYKESRMRFPKFSCKIRHEYCRVLRDHTYMALIEETIADLWAEACILAREWDWFVLDPQSSKVETVEHISDDGLNVLCQELVQGNQVMRIWVERACPQYLEELTSETSPRYNAFVESLQ